MGVVALLTALALAGLIVYLFIYVAGRALSSERLPLSFFRDNLFYAEPVLILSNLSLDEAKQRLQKNVISSEFVAAVSGRLAGTVTGGRFVIRSSRMWANPGRPVLSGHVYTDQQDGKTYLRGVFRLDPVVRTFVTFLFGATILSSALTIPAAVPRIIEGEWSGLISALAPLAFLFVGVIFIRRTGDQNVADRAFVIERLQETIDGEVVAAEAV